jgi:hypothetical protein
MPDTPPPPTTVWAEDLDPHRPPPRTDPPRHAERQASEVYDRVAGGTRTRRPVTIRPRWRGYAVGVGLLAIAGVVAWWQLDLGLMRMPSLALAVAGVVMLVKAVMGYR